MGEEVTEKIKSWTENLLDGCQVDVKELMSFKSEVEQWAQHTTSVISALPLGGNAIQVEIDKLSAAVGKMEK